MKTQALALIFNLSFTQAAADIVLDYNPITDYDFRSTTCVNDGELVRFKNHTTSDIPGEQSYMYFFLSDTKYDALWAPMITFPDPAQFDEEGHIIAFIEAGDGSPIEITIERHENIGAKDIKITRNDYERIFNQGGDFGITPTGWTCTSRMYEPHQQD